MIFAHSVTLRRIRTRIGQRGRVLGLDSRLTRCMMDADHIGLYVLRCAQTDGRDDICFHSASPWTESNFMNCTTEI